MFSAPTTDLCGFSHYRTRRVGVSQLLHFDFKLSAVETRSRIMFEYLKKQRLHLNSHTKLHLEISLTRLLQGERSPNFYLYRICNTVVRATTNPPLALKTNLTDSCDGGSPPRLAINESRSFRSLAIKES